MPRRLSSCPGTPAPPPIIEVPCPAARDTGTGSRGTGGLGNRASLYCVATASHRRPRTDNCTDVAISGRHREDWIDGYRPGQLTANFPECGRTRDATHAQAIDEGALG